jgi:predicted  nucleic acid-binding Zn-ribbon protein
MSKSARIVVAVVIIALIGSTAVLFQKYRQTSANYADVKAAEETARSQYAEAFNSIGEIQDSLNAITAGEKGVALRSQSLQAERRLSEPSRAEVLESISLMNASIQRTKERIGDLEKNLHASGVKVAGLQRMVSNLKKSVVEKEEQVAALTGQVNELQTQVTGLQTTVQEAQDTIVAKNQAIEDRQRELGTVYYVVGDKKMLKQNGLIVSKGGVLGLGKTVQLTGNFNDQVFTAMNTDQELVIKTPATKVNDVKVLSPQPPSSYELVPEGDGVALRILDPVEFRKIKHVVIMT